MLQKVHAAVSVFLNESFARWSLRDFDNDVLWAMLAGVVLGLVLLSVLVAFPGEPLDHVYGKVSEGEDNRAAVVSAASDKENERNLHGTNFSQRQKLLEDDSISILSVLNASVYLLLFSGFVYFLNRDYDNAATKWFVRTFPREAETLGLHSEL